MNAINWLKLPIIGAPGSECGMRLLPEGQTEVAQDFKDEFGPCDEPGRWLAGMLFLCQKHAGIVAAEFGDDIEKIEAAWRRQLSGG